MHRRRGNRSDISSDNKKSGQNPHLSSEQLLLVLDGELPSREAVQAKAHLEACWSCRARSEQIEEVIADVVEYRDYLIKAHLSLSAGARVMFVAQLKQLVLSAGRPALWSRVLGRLRALQTFSRDVVPRHVWISGIVIAAFTFLLLTRFSEVPRVSASQFLTNAQASEARAVHGVVKPVVYEKLRIRLGSRAVTRTIYRDREGERQVDHLDSGSDREVASKGRPIPGTNRSNAGQVAEAEIQQTFRTARLNWEEPLSPASYGAWHSRLSQKQDEVTQVGDDFLTLKTTTIEGPITEASITVRTTDFHPVAEDLRLQDAQQIEVSELVWQVIPMEAMDPAIFPVDPAASPVVARPTLPIPAGPTEAELAEAELQARVAMHAVDADLGEQIELDVKTPNFAPYAQRSLVIRGIVSTPGRKAEVSAAVRRIPHVELQLQTVEEALAQENEVARDKSESAATQQSKTSDPTSTQNAEEPDTPPHREGPNPIPEDAVVGKPALEEQMEQRFPNSEERAAFVNRAVEIAQDALAQAWALRRLRDRYAREEVARLSRGSRQTLELLIHDHVSALRQRVDTARSLILPLLQPEPTRGVPSPPTLGAPLPVAEPANDWRSAISDMFPEVQSVQIKVAALFAGPGEAVSDRQTRALDLQLALDELETQLRVLYERVSGPFLSESRNVDK